MKDSLSLFPQIKSSPAKVSGSAIVIVLAFIVLLSAIVLAVFNRAISERKISASSANQMKVGSLADGALASVIGSLKSEVADPAKSTEYVLSSGGKLYFPKTPQDLLPERQSDLPTGSLLNLLKRSSSANPFYSGGESSRAANLPTKDPSQNGRYISAARWNSHYLLRKKNTGSDTDATPEGSFEDKFAPDWILVDKDGGNPTAGNQDVVGRYAYAIYDEGGLLDLNAAGYPSIMLPNDKAQRGSLAFVDLTQLTESPDGTGAALLTDAQVDAIIGRRNYVSVAKNTATGVDGTPPSGDFPDFRFTQENAENYRRFAIHNSTNFLTIPRNNSLSGKVDASDRMFITRQEMIAFLLGGVAKTAAERANLQNALQYFCQFTRDLNQPSIMPPTGRPKIRSGYGNNAAGKDNDDIGGINPNFLKVSRQTATDPNNTVNGIIANAGDPVVKTRFPLNRLAWITFKGPIATDAGALSGDGDVQRLIAKYKSEGLTEEFLKKGTAKNIKNAFGLEWIANPDPLDTSRRSIWVYRPTVSGSVSTPKIRYLNEVATSNQEPDFFELLKASVTAGGITRASIQDPGAVATPPVPVAWQYKRDFSTQLATIQLGANIIDQFDPDGYPTQISIDDGTGPRIVSGVENLPYIYRLRTGMLMLRQAVPAAYVNAAEVDPAGNPRVIFRYSKTNGTASEPSLPSAGSNQSIRPNRAPEGPLTETGVAAYMVMPDIWNPHDSESNLGDPAPTEFRFVVDSIEPDGIKYGSNGDSTPTGAYNRLNAAAWKNNQQGYWSDLTAQATVPFRITGGFPGWNRRLSEQNSYLTFSIGDNDRTLFRDPAVLFMANRPAGSKLSLGEAMVNDTDLRGFIGAEQGDPMVKGFKSPGAFDQDLQRGIKPETVFVGIPTGMVPLRWIGPRPPNADTTQTYIHSGLWASMGGGGSARASISQPAGFFTASLRYKGADDKWVTYDQKYTQIADSSLVIPQGSFPAGPINKVTSWTGFVDPRTARFGPMRSPSYPVPSAGSIVPGANDPNSEWLNADNGYVITDRPDAGNGVAVRPGDWNAAPGSGFIIGGDLMNMGLFAQNTTSKPQYYSDADGVYRPGMAGNSSGTVGQPLATGENKSRPKTLNRPFRNVGELGFVFSGNPWKNIDFFSPRSAYAGLLDVFCISETADPTGLVAGKVNLNTKQVPVLKAIISGAYTQDVTLGGSTLQKLDQVDATNVAQALVARTSTTGDPAKGPLQNVSELVGKWVSGSNGNSAVYSGFSKDLFGDSGAGGVLQGEDAHISAFGESVVRSLASVGSTRVWNLMIDLVAQTGKFPGGGAGKFVVEGEQRYWVHVAIDRYTGQILDMNTEIVKE